MSFNFISSLSLANFALFSRPNCTNCNFFLYLHCIVLALVVVPVISVVVKKFGRYLRELSHTTQAAAAVAASIAEVCAEKQTALF